jgi:exonuclease III
VSKPGVVQDKKIHAITKQNPDIIFISDIRLNTEKQNYGVHDLTKKFKFKGYDFYHNSKKSHRGVGILIKSNLNIDVDVRYNDPENNILLVTCTINNVTVLLGSLYGPNNNDPGFFNNLSVQLDNYKHMYIILGGDLNATWDNRGPNDNLDILNMNAIPSRFRSDKFNQIATKFNLTDPYRFQHPNKIEFTYVPNARANTNRSRLDFFLVTESLCGQNLDCWISNTILTTAFDHKLIGLTWKNSGGKKNTDKNVIKDQILKNPAVSVLMRCVVMECHLVHSDPESVPAYLKNELLENLGVIFHKIKLKGKLELNSESYGENNSERIEELMAEISDSIETLPDLPFFENLPKSCDSDIFFEALVMHVKTHVLAEQQRIFNTINAKKLRLTKRLLELRKNTRLHSDEIFAVEHELASHTEKGLRDELENMALFERLNNERITPYFLKLAKQVTSSDSTNIIKDPDDPEPAVSNEDYITGFYENLYKNPNINEETTENDIVEFLGETADLDEIKNSKLSVQEKSMLDRDLTIFELDNAINESNKKSAPGIDGFSNRFIDTFWHYFRVPLLNYANCCFEKERLTDNFRTAKIRLIPKKGDKTRIGNWRPISLLSCFYKILSRVYANRLKKVIDKITAVGQKGYSKTKQCQEVLISIITGIEICKIKKIKGAILSLDIKKAFDSVSHTFMRAALKFFNFGDAFIGKIMTLCTNRMASIIFENNKLGRRFNLERGNAQGDTISPFLFNIAYQILIFKLNYDLQIEGFLDVPAIPDTHSPLDNMVSKKPRKVFAFADDCTILCVLKKSNFERINRILHEYYLLSGLECNVDKSVLKPVGNIADPVPENETAGFKIEQKITILGLTFEGDGLNFETSQQMIMKKVQDKINTWRRFNLGITGRINIAKTMLYSQVNYLGCFLRMDPEVETAIESKIKNYVKANLRIAENRIFLPVEQGGLGLFRIHEFLDSQRCMWIKRAKKIDELWKILLYIRSPNNIFCINTSNFCEMTETFFFDLARCNETLMAQHTRLNKNFLQGYILNNKAFTVGFRDRTGLRNLDISNDDNRIRLSNLKFSDITDQGVLKTRQQLINQFNFRFTDRDWHSLQKIFSTAMTRFSNNIGLSRSYHDFWNMSLKGSRYIRKILVNNRNIGLPHNIVKYASNTEVIIGREHSNFMNSFWNSHFLSSSLSTFYFKLINNILGFNYIISHFVPDVERSCTFCDVAQLQDEEDETPLHLFYSCSISETILTSFFQDFIGLEVTRQEFFSVPVRENQFTNMALVLINLLVKKFFWDCKMRFSLPCIETLKVYVTNELRLMAHISKKIDNLILGSDFNQNFKNICRRG